MTKPNINYILDEYVSVTNELKKLKEYVYELRDISLNNINNADSDEEKKMFYNKFKQDIDQIKNNKDFIKKYRSLKKKQNELIKLIEKLNTVDTVDNKSTIVNLNNNNKIKNKLINSVNNNHDISGMINEMLNKYENTTIHIPLDPDLLFNNLFSRKNKSQKLDNINKSNKIKIKCDNKLDSITESQDNSKLHIKKIRIDID